MNTRSDAFLREAERKLELAKEELLKPAEDIVSFSVCKNAQFAIENFLKGVLVRNSIDFTVDDTIAELYDKCLAVDKNFKEIDLGAIGCKDHAIDSRYCTEINSVSACFDTADSIDTYLRKSNLR